MRWAAGDPLPRLPIATDALRFAAEYASRLITNVGQQVLNTPIAIRNR